MIMIMNRIFVVCVAKKRTIHSVIDRHLNEDYLICHVMNKYYYYNVDYFNHLCMLILTMIYVWLNNKVKQPK